MKKTAIITSTVILIIVIGFLCLYFAMTSTSYIGEFSVSEFEYEIDNPDFQSDINCGEITDFRTAAKMGKTVISECFENADGSIFRWMACDIMYDEVNDVYYIRTYRISPLLNGGAYDVIVQSDGTVLAVWGEK